MTVVRGGLVARRLQGSLPGQQRLTQMCPAAAARARRGGGGGGGVVLPRGPDTDYWHCRLGSLFCWWRGGGGGWWCWTSAFRTELVAGAPLPLPGTAGDRPGESQETLTTIPRVS